MKKIENIGSVNGCPINLAVYYHKNNTEIIFEPKENKFLKLSFVLNPKQLNMFSEVIKESLQQQKQNTFKTCSICDGCGQVAIYGINVSCKECKGLGLIKKDEDR